MSVFEYGDRARAWPVLRRVANAADLERLKLLIDKDANKFRRKLLAGNVLRAGLETRRFRLDETFTPFWLVTDDPGHKQFNLTGLSSGYLYLFVSDDKIICSFETKELTLINLSRGS